MKKSLLLFPIAIFLVMSLFLVSCENEPELKSYTVTFLLNEGDTEPFDKKTVIEGTSITDAKVPEKTGYKFLYWKTVGGGNDAYDLKSPVKGDLTLIAAWEINKYTVSFIDGEEKAADPQTVEYGKKATAPADPTKDGHTFSCWKKVGSSSPFDFETEEITEDTVLEAVWDTNTYKVTFKNSDGSTYDEKEVLYNGKVESPKAPDPKEEKDEFKYWTADTESKEVFKLDATPIEGNLILYPVFGIKKFTVTFVDVEGISSIPEETTVEYGQNVKDPKTTANEGYKFLGWKIEGAEGYFSFETKITSDITLQAVCESLRISVSFYNEKGECLSESGEYEWGKDYNFPSIDIPDGFKLDWIKRGNTTPVDQTYFNLPYSETEYIYDVYLSTDLLSIDANGSVKATDALKKSTEKISLSIPYSIEGKTVTSIGNYAFQECSSLISIEIPASCTSIGAYAFEYCKSLQTVDIAEGCTSIGNSAFRWCDKLESIIVPSTVNSLGEFVFAQCPSLKSADIRANVSTLNGDTFNGCDALETISLSSTVSSLPDYIFRNLKALKTIDVPIENKNLSSVDGVLYDKNKTKLICYPAAKLGKSFTIPDTVTTIGRFAFENNQNLTSIIIPSSVISIGNQALYSCSKLTDVYINQAESTLFDGTFISSKVTKHWNSTGPESTS